MFTLSADPAAADCTVVPGVVTDGCAEDLVTTTTTAPPPPTTAPTSGSGSGGSGGGAATGAPVLDTGAARRLVELANQERRQRGAPSVSLRADVTQLAAEHSRAMATDGRLRHNDAYFSAAVKQRLGAQLLGENVAMNPDVDDAHRRLMASPGHRSNLIDPRFTVVGFAVVRDGNGQLWVTQAFVQPAGAGRPTAAVPGSGPGAGAEGDAEDAGGAAGAGDDADAAAASEEAALPRAVLGRRAGSGWSAAAASTPPPSRPLVLAGSLLSLAALAASRTHLRRHRHRHAPTP